MLNLAYRYNRDETAPIDQIDFSAQWPVSGRLYGVGRLNYSFKDSSTAVSTNSQNGRVIQSIAGLEYNGGCWVVDCGTFGQLQHQMLRRQPGMGQIACHLLGQVVVLELQR